MRQSHIAILGAPLDLGQSRRGVDMGPSAIRVANLNQRVASLGYHVDDLGNLHVGQREALPEGRRTRAICSRLPKLAAGWASPWTRPPPRGRSQSFWAAIIR